MSPAEFEKLADAYDVSTGFYSFRHSAKRTDEYRRLLAAGPVIVPLIIDRFRRRRFRLFWFPILNELTGEDRTVSRMRADGWVWINVSATAQAWIDWYELKPNKEVTCD